MINFRGKNDEIDDELNVMLFFALLYSIIFVHNFRKKIDKNSHVAFIIRV